MEITISPHILSGTVHAIPSKSQAHRLLICAAFADQKTHIICAETNQDIEATVSCLRALGADIERTESGYIVSPVTEIPSKAFLDCRESGSTLRFMLPVAGALGIDTTFIMSGRLPQRPLSPLWEEMERMGCTLSRPTENTIHCFGRLTGGQYSIDGSISSQFITGLLFAMAILDEPCKLTITGKIESAPYIAITRQAMELFGVETTDLHITSSWPFTSPGKLVVEGDWSNGAFFLGAAAIGNKLAVCGLDANTVQGDRAAAMLIEQLDNFITIDAADIPDLVPILSVVAGAKKGAKFINIGRLRLKESDRVQTVSAMLRQLGANVEETEDTLTVYPSRYRGCTIDSCGDHRIAMSAAIAATIADGPVTILKAQSVEKSYPSFWRVYQELGGNYEQHIR